MVVDTGGERPLKSVTAYGTAAGRCPRVPISAATETQQKSANWFALGSALSGRATRETDLSTVIFAVGSQINIAMRGSLAAQ